MTTLTLPSALVDVAWLAEHIDHPQLIILDATSYMPGAPNDALQEWREQHIPHSHFFDFNETFADKQSDLPHMLPSPEVFTAEARALGINKDSVIVIYDSAGIFSAPRGWWMFLAMGHTQCAVLNGGMPEWLAHKKDVEYDLTLDSSLKTATGNFTAHRRIEYIKNVQNMMAATNNNSINILDARSVERFNGTAKEPREGLISGHIPSSQSLPFDALLQDGKYKPLEQLTVIIDEKIKSDQALYASCGSGVTACIIALAAHLAGIKNVAVYDGSWCEWGDPKNNLPINKKE